jgi:hypothetical protein
MRFNTLQQGGFAAARGPDERGDAFPLKIGVDVDEGLEIPIIEIESSDADFRGGRSQPFSRIDR